ncbi:hypothetical protein ACFOD0_00100 [Shewanella intestini]|uniref:DNA repair protein n=1 Tax=Shewanella intestini TaxID=2017544 RepID=A0ABS5I6P8_9GAMM|nr:MULTISPECIES: hypothetical protein [Shewanella]MBR9729498.1 hypothetical protein [Shewanella intestini]MRG37572.1 hypothetical protein [Shewanella sp. XMDDZSB0408]
MSLIMVLVLVGALLLLVIGFSLIQQQKERAEAERRVEIARQRAIIDETENVLSHTGMVPCSNNIILVLYKRIEDALAQSISFTLGQTKSDYERRLIDLRSQIEKMKNTKSTAPSIETFRLPDNDKQILELVKTLKKLKAILRAEHNKGKVEPTIFTEEEMRIDSLQLRINVDSMISRARAACFMKQYGSSKQMVTKALNTLQAIKAQTPNDPFISKKVDEAKKLLEEITGAQKNADPLPVPPKKEGSELDMLFQPKKKW